MKFEILYKIQRRREELSRLVKKKEHLIDEEVLNKSKELEKLILKYINNK